MKHVIVTMSRGDAPRLAEWVSYHQSLGFDEFHVVLDNPTDRSAAVLQALDARVTIDVRGPHGPYFDRVPPEDRWPAVRQWRQEHAKVIAEWGVPIVDPLSMRQYMHLPAVLNKYAVRGDCWVAVIDVDEFLVIPGRTVQDVTAVAEHPRIRFLNFNFDTTRWAPGESVLTSCTNRWAREDVEMYGQGWQNRHKSIVRHDALLPLASVHAVSTGPFTVLDPEAGRLHHYKAIDQGLPLPYRITDTAAILPEAMERTP